MLNDVIMFQFIRKLLSYARSWEGDNVALFVKPLNVLHQLIGKFEDQKNLQDLLA